MNILEHFYSWGKNIHQSVTKPIHLGRPTLSVGNIASGGRSKTPLVIDIVRLLKGRGYFPVVLTRGFGRKSNKSEQVNVESIPENVGDEPLEIFLKTNATVLVGSKRAENALKYLKGNEKDFDKIIFVLDDGFQHWKIKKDYDVVIVRKEDLTGKLLPVGRLRELPKALERAQLVLQLGETCRKNIILPQSFDHYEGKLKQSNSWAFTTRADPQTRYFQEISNKLGFRIKHSEIRDHSPRLKKMIYELPKNVEHLILGFKEAVKVLPFAELKDQKDVYTLKNEDREFIVHIVDLSLEWDRKKFLDNFLKCVTT